MSEELKDTCVRCFRKAREDSCFCQKCEDAWLDFLTEKFEAENDSAKVFSVDFHTKWIWDKLDNGIMEEFLAKRA